MARARKKSNKDASRSKGVDKGGASKPDIVIASSDFDDDDYLDISCVFIIRDILIGLLIFGTLLAPFMAYLYMRYDDEGSCSSSLLEDDSNSFGLMDEVEGDLLDNHSHIGIHPHVAYKRWDVPCSTSSYDASSPSCSSFQKCGRVLKDSFITPTQVRQLRTIAEKGMTGRIDTGGPTIMDINSGFVKDGEGLTNIYYNQSSSGKRLLSPSVTFTTEEYELYKSVVEKVRQSIMQEFQLSSLYFTAPTFLTRLVGNTSWSARDMHDEYWHPHVDKENTWHYDYSGLIYLADYGKEFTGGLFAFLDGENVTSIEPASGRFLTFTAGSENLHQVQKVESGTRYLLSLWFTCSPDREFANFLDGKAHAHYKKTS